VVYGGLGERRDGGAGISVPADMEAGAGMCVPGHGWLHVSAFLRRCFVRQVLISATPMIATPRGLLEKNYWQLFSFGDQLSKFHLRKIEKCLTSAPIGSNSVI